MPSEVLFDHMVQALVVGAVGLFTFLVKSFFSRIHADLTALRTSIDKFEGRFGSLTDGMHRTTVELAVTRQELTALWRAIDGSHERASDTNGHGG